MHTRIHVAGCRREYRQLLAIRNRRTSPTLLGKSASKGRYSVRASPGRTRSSSSQNFDKKHTWRIPRDGVCWPTSNFASGVSRRICNSRGCSHPVPARPCVETDDVSLTREELSHEVPCLCACASHWFDRLQQSARRWGCGFRFVRNYQFAQGSRHSPGVSDPRTSAIILANGWHQPAVRSREHFPSSQLERLGDGIRG